MMPAAGPMYWSVRRELWESRSIYIAPLAVAGLILLGFLISTLFLPHELRGSTAINSIQQRAFIEQPYDFAALLIMLTTFLVAVFYCLDALHGERRDRSILFWKSLPVSDLTTVLSKAIIPIVVLPLVTFAITVVTQLIMLLVSSAVLAGQGLSIAPLWNHFLLLPMSLMLLYHLVAIHGLWYAPIYCWLLLVSGWARRVAFLWAVLPLLAIAVVEKISFNTSHFAAMLAYRMSGGREGAAFTAGAMSMDPLSQINPGHFLMSPGMWIGLAIAAVFLAAAVRLRRYRGPI
jgi:ABC-2 type transport system permease protein